jgi:hypothetical protein
MTDKTIEFDDLVDQKGYTSIDNVLLTDGSISCGAKVTWQLFCHYARQDEKCWPGQERLAGQVGVDGTTLRRYIGELVNLGLVKTKRQGLGKPNLYRLFRPNSTGKSPEQYGHNTRSESVEMPEKGNAVKETTESEDSVVGHDDVLISDHVDEILSVLNGMKLPRAPKAKRSQIMPVLEKHPEIDGLYVARKMANHYERPISRVAGVFTHWMEGDANRVRSRQPTQKSDRGDMIMEWMREYVE